MTDALRLILWVQNTSQSLIVNLVHARQLLDYLTNRFCMRIKTFKSFEFFEKSFSTPHNYDRVKTREKLETTDTHFGPKNRTTTMVRHGLLGRDYIMFNLHYSALSLNYFLLHLSYLQFLAAHATAYVTFTRKNLLLIYRLDGFGWKQQQIFSSLRLRRWWWRRREEEDNLDDITVGRKSKSVSPDRK